MDLSKVKTLLIMAFLGLNIFLGYKLWFDRLPPGQGSTLSSSQVEEIRQVLAENGFELQTAIPRQIPQLSLLTVSRSQKQPVFWSDLFLGNEKYSTEITEGGQRYLTDHSVLTIKKSGQVVYKKTTGEREQETFSAEKYLQQWGLWDDGMKLDLTIPITENTTCHRFFDTFQGFPLYSSTTEVYFHDREVTEVRINRLVPQGFSENKVTVISALYAVNAFVLADHNFVDKKIVDISLGYYSPYYDASSWEAVPVWRIAAADGRVFYINAFSGETESEE